MFEWLKDHFVPHEGNDHRPYFLRAESTALIVALVLLLEVAYLAGTLMVFPKSGYFAEVIATVLVDETNQQRSESALKRLSPNPLLEAAAKLKANDMATRGYFSHNTPDGKTPWEFLREVGYRYQAAGENLAVNFTDSRDVTQAWMNSPSHRANILNANYTEIGIATARGTYKGQDAIFVVQYFGKPKFGETPRVAAAPISAVAVDRGIQPTASVLGTTTDGKGVPAVLPVTDTTAPLKRLQADSRATESFEPVSSSSFRADRIEDPSGSGTETSVAEVLDTAPVPAYSAPAPGIFARILAMPRAFLSNIFIAVALLIFAALLLTILVKIRIQHPFLIANAVLLLAIVIALLLLNVMLAGSLGNVL